MTPRVTDPAMVPRRPASDAARELLELLSNHLADYAREAGDAIILHVEALIDESSAGRTEGVIACLADVLDSIAALRDALRLAKTTVQTVCAIDPEHAADLYAIKREGNIRHMMNEYRGTPLAIIRAHRSNHRQFCNQPGCIHIAALDRAERRAMGGE